jgi:hypothetical protein
MQKSMYDLCSSFNQWWGVVVVAVEAIVVVIEA